MALTKIKEEFTRYCRTKSIPQTPENLAAMIFGLNRVLSIDLNDESQDEFGDRMHDEVMLHATMHSAVSKAPNLFTDELTNPQQPLQAEYRLAVPNPTVQQLDLVYAGAAWAITLVQSQDNKLIRRLKAELSSAN